MRLLSRYLIRHNLFLLGTILLAGIGLYLLTDLFERLDDFIEAGLGASTLLAYMLVKVPLIVSQILPAVFFLSLVLQLYFLERSRERIALQAGGVSPMVLLRFILIYSILWAGGQLLFSQVLGVMGERTASRIWEEDVRKHSRENATLKGLWFTEKNYIIHIDVSYPAQSRGEHIQAYALTEDGSSINEIIRAESFTIEDGKWILHNGEALVPARYAKESFLHRELPVQQHLRTFQLSESRSGKQAGQLSLFELAETIKRLQQAGSNVESLRTVWHGKLAYAASLIVLGVLSLIISQITGNIYKAIVLSLLLTFLYYTLNTLGLSLGEKGILAPACGAWLANSFFSCLALIYFVVPLLRRTAAGGRRAKR